MAKRRYNQNEKPLHNFFQGFLIFLAFFILVATCAGVIASKLGFIRIDMDMSIPETSQIQVEYGSVYEVPDVTASITGRVKLPEGEVYTLFTYNDISVTEVSNVNTQELGSYQAEYTARFLWVEQKALVNITVTDEEAPVIELNGDSEIVIDPGEKFDEAGFTATDNYDGNLTKSVAIEGSVDINKCGTYVIEYSVADSSGNKTKIIRTITVRDNEPPVITLSGDEKMTVTMGQPFEDPGYSVLDNADSKVDVVVENLPDMSTPGKYEVTYRAVDSSGNEAIVTRIVYVKAAAAAADTGAKDPSDKVVYLTFDDGPGQYTQQLLDVLKKYDVKATFFVTNQFPGYKNMITMEHEAGHTVAIHTYTHDFATVYASTEAFFDDVKKMSDLIKDLTGETATILRFPGGSSNTVSKKYCSGIMTAIADECNSRGYLYCDWNVDSEDAGGAKTAEEVAQNVINGIKSCKVSWVLQHDIKKFSVDAVETIIKWGQENGYTFLPLTSQSPMRHHSINN